MCSWSTTIFQKYSTFSANEVSTVKELESIRTGSISVKRTSVLINTSYPSIDLELVEFLPALSL